FAIPFHVLRFPSRPAHTWAVNFGRLIHRSREESYWVPLSRRDGRQALYRFAKGGRLTGLSGIQPGGKLQVIPFSVLGAQGSRFNRINPSLPSVPIAVTGFNNVLERQAGADLKWSVTSGLTLNATANPDFAQVEADDQVVNLSRFELQFPEKRPFFLERSDIFSLAQGGGGGGGSGGGRGGDVPQIFFSRRIGRGLSNGTPVPIDLGMRFTGKIGKTTLGFLNVQTRETSYTENDVVKIEPVINWQALRISQDIGRRSSVGILATFKEPNPAGNDRLGMAIPRYASKDYNRVIGFDGNIAFQKSQHQLQVMYAQSWTDTLQNKEDQFVWRIQERWQNRWMGYGFSYMETGRNFIAQTGFVTQTNIRRIGMSTNFSTFIRKWGIRQLSGGVRTNYLARMDRSFSNPATWQVNLNFFLELERGIWLGGAWNRSFDTLSNTTRINSVHFSPGSYGYGQGNLSVSTNPGKPVSAEGEMRFGKFYNADILSLSGELSLKPNARFSAEPAVTWTRITRTGPLAFGGNQYDYNSRMIPRIRSTYSFTPNFSISTFIQLNIDKRRTQDAFHLNTVTTNFLLSYRSPYGHSFFLAFNQFHDDALDAVNSFDVFARKPLRMREQTLVAKMSYLFNL
ncbi:MAG: hypothetical protein FJY97_11595, partial [candidate division Zixibacteria bacterium]|nr:hypothetical protein [candidate division Zixibacteria bacterium]